jgi:hypothetical protein
MFVPLPMCGLSSLISPTVCQVHHPDGVNSGGIDIIIAILWQTVGLAKSRHLRRSTGSPAKFTPTILMVGIVSADSPDDLTHTRGGPTVAADGLPEAGTFDDQRGRRPSSRRRPTGRDRVVELRKRSLLIRETG